MRLPESELACWRVRGAGPPLVCVHGAGVSSRESMPLLERLRGSRETWAVDLPGHGSSREVPVPRGVRGFRDAVLEFLDAAALVPAHLLGWSFGAQIAAGAAADAPERVRGLVLVGVTVDPDARTFARQFARWLANGPHEPFGLTREVFRDYRTAGPRPVVAAFRAALDDRIEEVLPRVQAPALVVRGEHDRMVPQEWAEEVVRLLPRGRLSTWPGAAHVVPHSDPGGLAAAVEQFLEDV